MPHSHLQWVGCLLTVVWSVPLLEDSLHLVGVLLTNCSKMLCNLLSCLLIREVLHLMIGQCQIISFNTVIRLGTFLFQAVECLARVLLSTFFCRYFLASILYSSSNILSKFLYLFIHVFYTLCFFAFWFSSTLLWWMAYPGNSLYFLFRAELVQLIIQQLL